MASNAPEVIHDAADWLVLRKPAGWHTVARRGRAEAGDESPAAPDVESWVRASEAMPWARELDEAGLVHRLDFETSGCLLAAKSAEAQQRLRRVFQTGEGVRKLYRALISSGGGLPERGAFRLFFTSRYKRSKKVTVGEDGEAKHEGRCAWRIVQRAAARVPRADLVEVELVGPGRRHQIRAGFAHLDHPLLGDQLYGGPDWPHGFALHASTLEIEEAVVECPAPEAWGSAPGIALDRARENRGMGIPRL